ncbi:cytosine permease [Arsenophonus sp. PmNCSU2021_1]|uniref:cytosine permease n=1 Tax=Arsenophonus sp. PmNCSU2021_1 TaxID=3118989 RepID=UPI002FF304BA
MDNPTKYEHPDFFLFLNLYFFFGDCETRVILSVVKVNDINLYTSSLGLANSLEILTGKKWDYFKLTIYIGLTGTLLSMMGILNHFVDFLSMMGVIFPPIAGVMLVDYYILKTSRKLLDKTREQGLLPDDSSTPIIACILGTIVGVVLKFGIPSLNSIFVAAIAYCILMKIQDYNITRVSHRHIKF